jgi:Predicted periplasmic lipoprotein (DUF2279)
MIGSSARQVFLPRVLAVVLLGPVLALAGVGEERMQADSLPPRRLAWKRAVTYTSAYLAGSMAILGFTWYRDRDVVPFHFYDDNRGFLQVDKFGHAFGSHVYSLVGLSYFQAAGYARREAILLGGAVGFILQTPIELMDGIHEGYGFSWGDMAANAAGSALVMGQEWIFSEQVARFKYSYRPSPEAERAEGTFGKAAWERPLKDYNGQAYWLSFPLDPGRRNPLLPDWLCLSFGYGANGMYSEFEPADTMGGDGPTKTARYREYMLSLDIDWSRIKTDSPGLKVLLRGLAFFKMPFPALVYESRGRFAGYWIH